MATSKPKTDFEIAVRSWYALPLKIGYADYIPPKDYPLLYLKIALESKNENLFPKVLKTLQDPKTYSRVKIPEFEREHGNFEKLLFLIGLGDKDPKKGKSFLEEQLRNPILKEKKAENSVLWDLKQAISGKEKSLTALKKMRKFKYQDPEYVRKTPGSVKNQTMGAFEKSVFHLGMGENRKFRKGACLVVKHRQKVERFLKSLPARKAERKFIRTKALK